MVARLTRCSGVRNSPWIRTWPREGFSLARACDRIGEVTVDARPPAAMQVGPSPGIGRQACTCLGSSRINAANTARSSQDTRGLAILPA
jgi:hypothetical protein